MPQLKTLEVTVGSNPYAFNVSSNQAGVAEWSLASASGTLDSNGAFSVGIRNTTNKQTTRKATAVYIDPLVSTCETTCSTISRGVAMFRMENVVSVKATLAERELAYDRYIALLQLPEVRSAFVKNEAFYS